MGKRLDRYKEWYNVAVIDSGIGEYGRYFRNSYAGQINFIFDEYGAGKIFKESYFTGSHVCDVLRVMEKYKNNNKYRYHNYNIVNRNGKSSSSALLKALEYLQEQDEIDMIVACLSYDSAVYHNEIQRCCSSLRKKGKIIFIAENYDNDSISNHLEDVILVKKGMYKMPKEYGIESGNENQIYGNILPEFVLTERGRYTLFGGTSMATAKAASMLSTYYLRGDLQKILQSRSLDKIKNIDIMKCPSERWIRRVWKMLAVILQEIGEQDRLEKASDCPTMELLNDKEKYDLLIAGFNRWCTEWKMENMNYYDFGMIYSIARWFEENEAKYPYHF